MDYLRIPDKMNFHDGNVAENWRRFLKHINVYSVASGLTEKSQKVQSMTFLNIAGPEAQELHNSFAWVSSADSEKLEPTIEQFNQYCIPKKNIAYERHLFSSKSAKWRINRCLGCRPQTESKGMRV